MRLLICLGVNIKTVQRWEREGRLKAAGRTATGRRYYTEDQILVFRHQHPAPTGPRSRKGVTRRETSGPYGIPLKPGHGTRVDGVWRSVRASYRGL
ncbi:MAG: MerR family transcriptional regulator [Firmicutes bacterium]|nr:MerR family transcriptional regulator [Bacillota bacterium]